MDLSLSLSLSLFSAQLSNIEETERAKRKLMEEKQPNDVGKNKAKQKTGWEE